MDAFDPRCSVETYGEMEKHLIVWIDLSEPGLETAIATVVSGIVNDFLPGSTLAEMVKNPF